MKKFKAHVVEMRTVEFDLLAKSKKEAAEKVRDIVENTDLIDGCDADFITVFNLAEATEDEDDGYNEKRRYCVYDDEEESLIDEMY